MTEVVYPFDTSVFDEFDPNSDAINSGDPWTARNSGGIQIAVRIEKKSISYRLAVERLLKGNKDKFRHVKIVVVSIIQQVFPGATVTSSGFNLEPLNQMDTVESFNQLQRTKTKDISLLAKLKNIVKNRNKTIDLAIFNYLTTLQTNMGKNEMIDWATLELTKSSTLGSGGTLSNTVGQLQPLPLSQVFSDKSPFDFLRYNQFPEKTSELLITMYAKVNHARSHQTYTTIYIPVKYIGKNRGEPIEYNVGNLSTLGTIYDENYKGSKEAFKTMLLDVWSIWRSLKMFPLECITDRSMNMEANKMEPFWGLTPDQCLLVRHEKKYKLYFLFDEVGVINCDECIGTTIFADVITNYAIRQSTYNKKIFIYYDKGALQKDEVIWIENLNDPPNKKLDKTDPYKKPPKGAPEWAPPKKTPTTHDRYTTFDGSGTSASSDDETEIGYEGFDHE